MNGRNAGQFKVFFQTEIKIRRIHTDKNIRWLGKEMTFQPITDREQPWQVLQYLHQPHYRQAFHRNQTDHPLALHQGAADSIKNNLWHPFFQLAHQAGAEQISGWLIGHDSYSQVRFPHLSHMARNIVKPKPRSGKGSWKFCYIIGLYRSWYFQRTILRERF